MAKQALISLSLTPNEAEKKGIKIKKDGIRRTAFELLANQETQYSDLAKVWPTLQNTDREISEQLAKDALYSNYINRQVQDLNAIRRDEARLIPVNFDYETVSSLSTELQLKLSSVRPENIAQASRISGMTPVGLALILANLDSKKIKNSGGGLRGLLELDVSRETLDALKYFEDLVVLWNPAINLISNRSVSDLWSRHIVDSAQLFLFTLPDEGLWLDVGSGGGFPGIVVSIVAKELAPRFAGSFLLRVITANVFFYEQ